MSQEWTSLGAAALAVLGCADANAKAAAARRVAAAWRADGLEHSFPNSLPERPARPAQPVLLPPGDMPRRSAGGSADKRAALLHAVAHIELNAIDLAFDILARFGAQMPRAFADDWVQVGDDEARHFHLVAARLAALDSHYGALPAHDGLWQSAQATAGDLAARLAVVPMVLEARGLDVTPPMIERFRAMGDAESAEALEIIYADEVTHVAAGRRWFDWLCARRGDEPGAAFQDLVGRYFTGRIKRPFNDEARAAAGLPAEFYEPLAG